MRARKSNRLVALAGILAVAALVLAASQATWAGGHGHGGGKKLTCRGPGSLSDGFSLSGHRKVTAKRADCATARKVVKRFPSSCARAYAGQGHCKVRASAKWRCRSHIVGPLSAGAPSKEKCKHRRSRIKFEVAYFIPTEPRNFTPSANARAPYDTTAKCVDTTPAGDVVPPPNPSGLGNFEIHLLNGVPRSVGEDLQAALVSHRVSSVLHAGLGSDPRNAPARVPIFLTRGNFDGTTLGVAARRARTEASMP